MLFKVMHALQSEPGKISQRPYRINTDQVAWILTGADEGNVNLSHITVEVGFSGGGVLTLKIDQRDLVELMRAVESKAAR